MKNKLIKLAKALKLHGHNFHSSKILKIADGFDNWAVETNYDKVYSQINTFMQDLKGAEDLDFFAKAPLMSVGLQHIVGSLDESSVEVIANIEEIGSYDDVPEKINVEYIVTLNPIPVATNTWSKTRAALTQPSQAEQEAKIKMAFDEQVSDYLDKHQMKVRMPKEVEFYDRRSLDEITEDNARPRNEKVKEMFREEDPLDDGTSDAPLRQHRVRLDSSEKQAVGPRFTHETSVRIIPKLITDYGDSARGEDKSKVLIKIHYTITIDDPKKDTARRNDLNKKHQEKMKEDKRKAEIAEAIREEYLMHLSFIGYLSGIQNKCQSIQSPSSAATSRDPKVKACEVIIGRLNQFKDFYGITKLDEPIKEEIAKSILKSKGSAATPSTGLLFENSFGSPNFEESIELIGESRPMSIPYRLK